MRYSLQRNLILEKVRNSKLHPTAQQVFEQVMLELPKISLATVYRDLNQLADHNLIKTVRTDSTVRYDGDLSEHHHFHCQVCGKLFDLDISLEEFVLNLKTNIKHDIMGYELILNGICKNC